MTVLYKDKKAITLVIAQWYYIEHRYYNWLLLYYFDYINIIGHWIKTGRAQILNQDGHSKNIRHQRLRNGDVFTSS